MAYGYQNENSARHEVDLIITFLNIGEQVKRFKRQMQDNKECSSPCGVLHRGVQYLN